MIRIFFLSFFCLKVTKYKSITDDDDEKKLLHFLFGNYDPEIHPVLKKTDTVEVKFGVSLHQIIEVVSPKWFLCKLKG